LRDTARQKIQLLKVIGTAANQKTRCEILLAVYNNTLPATLTVFEIQLYASAKSYFSISPSPKVVFRTTSRI